MLRDVFGIEEHQEKVIYGLGYKLVIMRNSVDFLLTKGKATSNGRIKNNGTEWYVPHYTPTIPQQALLYEQILSKVPTEFQYVERSVFMRKNHGILNWGLRNA